MSHKNRFSVARAFPSSLLQTFTQKSSQVFSQMLSLAVMPVMIATLAIVTGALTACGTSPTIKTSNERGNEEFKSWMPVADRSSLGTGQVLLAYQLIDPAHEVPADGCRLRVENTQTKKSVFLTLKPNEPGSVTALEPGNYITRRLGCGLASVWTVEDLFSRGFNVEAGKVSYIGKLIFSFNQNKDLELIKKATRVDASDSLSVLLSGVVKGADDLLISGFTGKAITKDMLTGERFEGFDVRALGLQEQRVGLLTPLLGQLKDCSQIAGKMDPLRIGKVDYVGIFQSGRFQSIRDRVDTNALSDDLRKCIESSLQKFSFKNSNGEVRIRVRY